jgi:beta-glucosidase
MSRLNDMALRIVRTMFRLGIFDHPTPAQPGAVNTDVRRPADIALARTISEGGTVLLKNIGGVLPLTGARKKVAVIGPGAGVQGAERFYNGGGSGHIPELGVKADVVSPLQGIQRRAQRQHDTVLYADGSSQVDVVAAAAAADVAVVFVGNQDTESIDRSTLDLSADNCSFTGCAMQTVDQDQLIAKVAAANPNTIVVLNTGGPVLMPWLGHIKGLFEAWYPGQQDGNAIAALLFGDVNPAAKLPETFPKSRADIPTQTQQQYPGVTEPSGVPQATYSEGLLVGYRWYDAKRITPLFPFGFGLSYSSFRLDNLTLQTVRHGRPPVEVSFDVTNISRRAGAEVPQVYVADPRTIGEPPKQLEGFAKVPLAPGRARRVSIRLDSRAFAHWDSAEHRWRVTPGCYGFMVGSSSRDLPLHAAAAIGGARCTR